MPTSFSFEALSVSGDSSPNDAVNRRDFVATLSAGLAASRIRQERALKIGYAAITWGGNDRQAIEDISSLGYTGIQLRSNVLAQFGDRPADLRALLADRRLTFVALSSGSVRVDSADPAAMIDQHIRNARFLRDAGGLFLQLTVDRPPSARAVTDADFAAAGRLLSEIGRRTADLGIRSASIRIWVHSRSDRASSNGSWTRRTRVTCGCCSTLHTTGRAAAIRSMPFGDIATACSSFI